MVYRKDVLFPDVLRVLWDDFTFYLIYSDVDNNCLKLIVS